MIEFSINDLPKLPNQTLYSHWRIKQRERKKWQKLVMLHVAALRLNEREGIAIPFKRARLTLTRFSTREPDHDGLAFSWKHCVDGLVLAGVIVDDSPSVIGRPEYLWKLTKPRHGKVHIQVETV